METTILFYWDNGKENGNYYTILGVWRVGHIRIHLHTVLQRISLCSIELRNLVNSVTVRLKLGPALVL